MCGIVLFRVKASCITSGFYRNDVLQKSNETKVGKVKGKKRVMKMSNFAEYNI